MTSRLSEQDLADLCALADGSLPAERRAAIESRVAADPDLQELLERQRRAVAATRSLAAEPVPDSVRVAVAARRPKPLRGARSRVLVARLAAAGALAAAVAVVLVVLLGGPAGPTVAEAAQLAGRAAVEPAPPPSGAGGTRLDLDIDGVVFPDLRQAFGWRATGARRDTLDGRDAGTVFYEKDGERIAYVIVAGDGLDPPSGPPARVDDGVAFHTLQLDGSAAAVTWRRQGHTCVIVGAVPPGELLALARWRGDGTLGY